jgi:phenylpropionate dioxygenase-like ring-hydroxylating dioxygenase large terminal subunit
MAHPSRADQADLPAGFLEPAVYRSTAIALLERQHYATRFWLPIAALSQIPEGHVLALELMGDPILLTNEPGEGVRAFRNRCPHRGVAFRATSQQSEPCRKLVCPYHGWTYDLAGDLLAAARESEFLAPFDRADWPLEPLGCRELGSIVWVALAEHPIRLEEQLDLVLSEAGDQLQRSRHLLAFHEQEMACNWKIAHDNTLDDYHVAIAHPTTLHRVQGPVRHYRHRFGVWANVLATPYEENGGSGEFLTFGLPPWLHLLLWPDGRQAVIQFLPVCLDRCRMQVTLLGPADRLAEGEALMAEMVHFLAEDRTLVESAQKGYGEGFRPGPPHQLEGRILHQQAIYARLMKPWLGVAAAGQS